MEIKTAVLISVLVLLVLIFILQTIYVMATLGDLEKRIMPVAPHVPSPPRNLATFLVLSLQKSSLPNNNDKNKLLEEAKRVGAIRNADTPSAKVYVAFMPSLSSSTQALINGIQEERIRFIVLHTELYEVHYHDSLEAFMRDDARGVHRMPADQRLILLSCAQTIPALPLGISECSDNLANGRYLALAFGLP